MHRTVTVTGSGSAPVVLDSAVVRVVVACTGPSVARVLEGVEEHGAALRAAAGAVSGPERLASTGLHVWPHHDPEGHASGFEASHHFRVRCPDLGTASLLVAGLAEAVGDALRVEGVETTVSDPGAALVAAREAAYADALARAEHLAGLGGRRVADLLAISDGTQQATDGPATLATEKAGVTFEPGERRVVASVSATWQMV